MMQNRTTPEKACPVPRMIQMLDICAASQDDDEAALLLGMAAKALAQLQSHTDRVTAEATDRQGRYEQMEQSYDELAETNFDLEEENARLVLECQQLEADEGVHEDDVPETIVDVADEKEQRECTLMPGTVLLDASPRHEPVTSPMSKLDSFDFSGDVYKQLEQFEYSLDMQLEEFQGLGEDDNEKGAFDSESKQASSPPCRNVMVGKTLPVSPLLNRTPSKDANSASSRNPFQLLQRLFPTQSDDAPIPAMTTSDSMYSLSSEHSLSMNSRGSDLNSWTPTKKTMKMSSRGNAEWAIIE